MRGRRSPYTILGLRPGADRAAVEEAYRRLIKQHHPDLPGGDAGETAEINRAYALLKGRLPSPPLPAVPESPRLLRHRARRPGRVAGMLMLAAAGGALLLLPLPAEQGERRSSPYPGGQATNPGRLPLPDTFDLRSLPDQDSIATAVAAAQRLQRNAVPAEAVQFSQACDDDLKTFPSPSLLDHCVAFDTAMALLAGNAATARFRAEDMAARHVGAALRISDDAVLAEERIGRVRGEVGRMLAERRY